MRTAIVSTLSAAATLAMLSIASAQSDQRVSDRPRTTTNAPAATKNSATKNNAPKDTPTDDTNALTPEQEIAIPYRACINARGLVNGRLVCDDK